MPADAAGHGPSTRPPPGTPGTGDPAEVTTDCDEQSVISSLQSAHNADYARLPIDTGTGGLAAPNSQFWAAVSPAL
jgi:hypothetical protein